MTLTAQIVRFLLATLGVQARVEREGKNPPTKQGVQTVKVVRKEADLMMTARSTGYAIARWVKQWDTSAKAFIWSWKNLATGLSEADAAAAFDSMVSA